MAACTSFAGLGLPQRDGGATSGEGGDGVDAGDVGAYAEVVLQDGPIAYWRFEESTPSTLLDSSGNGRSCTARGGVVLAGAGAFDGSRALGFSGSEGAYADCGDTPFDFAGTAPFSLEAWVRVDTTDDTFRRVFSKEQYDGSNRRGGYNLDVHSAGGITFERFENGTELCAPRLPITLGKWMHVVATFDGGVARLYVDGQTDTDTCNSPALDPRSAPLTLGVQSDHNYGFFRGAIDEAAIYDKALTADRVTAHRAARPSGP